MRAQIAVVTSFLLFLWLSPILMAGAPGIVEGWPPPAWEPDRQKSVQADLQSMLLYLADEAEERRDLRLLATHFRSLEMVVDAYGESSPEIVEKLHEEFLADWENGPASWQAYMEGRPLYLAWKSPYDGAVTVTLVVLPKEWNPEQYYPLYFELHGAGGRKPLDTSTMKFIGRSEGIGLASYRREGFHVYPLNRVLTEYHGVGELDLWECLDMVDRYLNTDPARQYVFGFSMGGGGAWTFGAQAMEKRGWAAVASYSPVILPHEWMAGELSKAPVWICFGENDMGARKEKEDMRRMLREFGNEPEFIVVPETGHKYRGDYQEKMLEFLSSHVNESPVMPRWRTVPVLAHGDDEMELYVNGYPVSVDPETWSGSARIREGRNVVAAHVRNVNWAGGLIFAAEPGGGQIVKSDGDWRCTYRDPRGDWTARDYDDSAWAGAGAPCEVVSWAGYEKNKERMAPFASEGVKLIGAPPVQHYRKVFQSAAGEAEVGIRGVGFRHRIWLNNELIGEGAEYAGNPYREKQRRRGGETAQYPCKTVAGDNVVALEITSDQLNGLGILMKAAVFHRTDSGATGRVRTGPGWRVSPRAEDGWTELSFDDSAWTITDQTFINKAYDSGGGRRGDGMFTAYWLQPGNLYFRKVFEVEDGAESDD